MSLIEQAAKRLQELERAGIRAPVAEGASAAQAAVRTDTIPQKAARVAESQERREPALAAEPSKASVRNIDLGRLQAAGFITPNAPSSKLSHEFRIIKRPLIQNAVGRGAAPIARGNLIMVTSSLPGEGKSFVSVNLAMSLAMEVDCRVLLVDADVVRPSIPKLLGIRTERGLLDVLTEPSLTFGDVIHHTNVDRLSIALAGTAHRRSSELLASEAMTRLLEELSGRYPDRIVVFDSPPLLATTESRVLASRMGQVLVVVEADRTTHGALESALSTVEDCPVVLTMLNKSGDSDNGSYYGYYGHGG